MKQTNKNIFKMLIAASVLLVSSTGAFAQYNATASASATIITPITMSLLSNMNFGNVAVAAGTGGTVKMDTLGNRLPASGVTLPATSGTVSAASFTVSGAAGYTYSISFPLSCVITDGTHNMTVDAINSNPATTGTLGSDGTQKLEFGATLNVNAGQAAGAYTNTTGLSVTVNYN